MKKITFALLLFICNVAVGKNMVKVSGKILNATADSINISYVLPSIVYKPTEHKMKLGGDGRFSTTFEVPKGFTNIEIIFGDQMTETYVQPGAELVVTLDAKNVDSTVHYEGKGKELANFCAKYTIAHPRMETVEVKGQMLCKEEPGVFEEGLEKLEASEMEFLQKNGAHLPNGFADYYKTDCRYKLYTMMEKYPPFHEMMNKRNINSIPKESYSVVKNIPEAFNDDYINMQSYQSYVRSYYSSKIAAKIAELDLPKDAWPSMDSVNTLAYSSMPPKTAEYNIGCRIYTGLKYTASEKIELCFEHYKKAFPKSENVNILEKEITRTKKFGNGRPAIDFDITTLDGKKMKLSDLKGNVVMIDFWASWCMPCRMEMPAAKKIRTYFKDKPVSFVYISIDENEDAWKNAIKEFEVEGINACEGKGKRSTAAQKYDITSVPSYFIIDKQGNFAHADDLARPSETEKLTKQIEQLLN